MPVDVAVGLQPGRGRTESGNWMAAAWVCDEPVGQISQSQSSR
jgi:hypothetical protein